MSAILEIFRKTGAYLDNDHFVYSSGKHGDIYLNKNDVFADANATEQAAKLLAEKFKDTKITAVAGAAMCGVVLAHWVAYHLSHMKDKKIYNVFAEKNDAKQFAFTRGYDHFIRGQDVLIVDDITNSGATAKKMVHLVKSLGGNVVGIAVLVNRNPKEVNTESMGGIAFTALDSVQIPAYNEADCPLCQKHVPINIKVGHGKKYLASKT